MMNRVPLALIALVAMIGLAHAQQAEDLPPSQCLAIAQQIDDDFPVRFASMTASPLGNTDGIVTFTFAGHSTWQIETPEGVRVATDFSGFYGATPLPRIVTMNRAHSSHYTLVPDARIEHVLPGWDPTDPRGAQHNVVVDDIYVRNVPTDIRSWGDREGMIPNGNSIFIFETAGLCIGHLGHLHHPLTEDHFAAIGRLDVVMVPVDGGLTLSHVAMAELTERLRSSVVLPMHLRGRSIASFTAMMGEDWAVDFLGGDTVELSVRTLPRQPTIVVPAGLSTRG